MEQLEVHSKSYLIRWVKVSEGNTISWSLQPHKKSIQFGVFKHPAGANGTTPNLPGMRASMLEPPGELSPELESTSPPINKHPLPRRTSNTSSKDDAPSVTEKLGKLGIKSVAWVGKCEADRVTIGHYDVPGGGSGMYGLVFDNTHSKQMSKTITFVLMTYPTGVPPKSGHHIRHVLSRQASGSATTTKTSSPSLAPLSDSSEHLPQDLATTVKIQLSDPVPKVVRAMEAERLAPPSFYTGILSKKRRKKAQGYARRFFSLDFTTSTLSYYKDRNSSALRGAIPLSLAAIGANEETRQISIDSGTEVWLLRAPNQKEFREWMTMLEKAAQTSSMTPATPGSSHGLKRAVVRSTEDEEREWGMVENLVGRVAGITDAVRRLAKDTDPKYSPAYSPALAGLGLKDASPGTSMTISPIEVPEASDYFQTDDSSATRKTFWKRTSSNSGHSPSGVLRRTVSGARASHTPIPVSSPPTATIPIRRRPAPSTLHPAEEQVHDRCMAVLRDLDSVVAHFSALLAESRQRRVPALSLITSRNSIDSTRSADFFDAEDGLPQQIFEIDKDSDVDTSPERASGGAVSEEGDDDSGSNSDAEQDYTYTRMPRAGQPSFLPKRPKTLTPLPVKSSVPRRSTIPPSAGPPPSLISFVRKNAGKDLSTVAMPVSANEPLSLLQHQAESLEYSSLLDLAATATNAESGERLLHITAFALSALSSSRAKDRAIRKPFTPLLGETFELVREDKAFRFVAEKISHRPLRIASQAESKHWTFVHSPLPSQKFWGKSAELLNEGRARVVLHASGDAYSWTPPTCFLRNILAGEKYVEPVQSMTVVEETCGRKAIATFRAGGMFSGRSEDVSVRAFDADGQPLPLSMDGKWTTSLTLHATPSASSPSPPSSSPLPREIWHAGPLVASPASHYGFTAFAASLNELTPLEANSTGTRGGALPPTDSRLRPDQRAYEEGDVDGAEEMKARLEEAQRRRRKEMEGGKEWESRWFERVGGVVDGSEEVWVLKAAGNAGGGGVGAAGGQSYWEAREAVVQGRGTWEGVGKVFDLS